MADTREAQGALAHDHRHDDARAAIEDHGPAREYLWLEQAIRELLIERGVFGGDEVRRQIELMDSRSPAMGAKLVARAWIDAAFKALLLVDCRRAAEQLGIPFGDMPEVMVLENTARRHHLVVCTLCSCYPKGILGMAPAWYKSTAYRARAVVDPRGVLKEFGTVLGSDVEIRVMDSTADLRYLVMPMRPAGAEGWSEDELARLVTRDSMIGVSPALDPAALARAR